MALLRVTTRVWVGHLVLKMTFFSKADLARLVVIFRLILGISCKLRHVNVHGLTQFIHHAWLRYDGY